MFLEIKIVDIYRFIEAATGRVLTPTQEDLLLMGIEHCTPTGRIRSEIIIVGDSRQMPPGNYNGFITRMVMHDYDNLERRAVRVHDALDYTKDPERKKPRTFKDVPFWCKRR